MKRWQVLALVVLLIMCHSLVNNMDLKQQQREAEWAESRQALELEQEKIQLDIIEIREQLAKADEQLYSYNLLLWEMRERLHLDLELELEGRVIHRYEQVQYQKDVSGSCGKESN